MHPHQSLQSAQVQRRLPPRRALRRHCPPPERQQAPVRVPKRLFLVPVYVCARPCVCACVMFLETAVLVQLLEASRTGTTANICLCAEIALLTSLSISIAVPSASSRLKAIRTQQVHSRLKNAHAHHQTIIWAGSSIHHRSLDMAIARASSISPTSPRNVCACAFVLVRVRARAIRECACASMCWSSADDARAAEYVQRP